MSDQLATRAPAAWEFRPATADGSGGWLRIGHRAYAMRDISGVTSECRIEPNIEGSLTKIGVCILAGLAFLLTIALHLARPKSLIGAAMFGGIGMMGISERLRRKATRVHRVEIRLRDGSRIAYSTADAAEALALQSAVSRGAPGASV
jgi:hypothetical protein